MAAVAFARAARFGAWLAGVPADFGIATTGGVAAKSKGREEEEDDARSSSPSLTVWLAHLAGSSGSHGILSHFPVLIIGAIGVGMVMHRHWQLSTKVLAAATLGWAIRAAGLSLSQVDWRRRCSPRGGLSSFFPC